MMFDTARGTSQTFDPVCGANVDVSTAKGGASMHEGRVHYFCCHRCRSRFLLEPEAYVGGGSRALAERYSGE